MSIVLTNFKYGKIIVLEHDYYITKSLLYAGQYCDEEVEIFVEILKPGDTVIEVGSNVGALTIPIAKTVGKTGVIYAIEPQKYVYNILTANMHINNLSQVNTKNIAIGDEEKIVRLPILNYDKQLNFGGVSIKESNLGDEIVQCVLDTTFKSLPNLKLIKIDVEGMELSVLNGCKELIQEHKPFIYCENDRLENSNQLIKILMDLGYDVYEHISHVFNKKNIKGLTHNFFDKDYICKNVLAVPKELNKTFLLNKLN